MFYEAIILCLFKCVEVCNVFLKDKSSRFDHCHTDEHLNKFNAAEEERIKKEETDKKGSDNQTASATEEPIKDTIKVNENSTETKENTNQIPAENEEKTETKENTSSEQSITENNKEINDKPAEEPKKETVPQPEG